ncbi:hypothetical protein M3Y99_01123600 [Aphelenchoides fujianensis]|nr:hypothetical protein M3Y99_01123600 [Aphelenchoides fujianensis]
MGRKRRDQKLRALHRRMKTRDRQDDIPDCPSLDSLEEDPKSFDRTIERPKPAGGSKRKPKKPKEPKLEPKSEPSVHSEYAGGMKSEESAVEPSAASAASTDTAEPRGQNGPNGDVRNTPKSAVTSELCKRCQCAECHQPPQWPPAAFSQLVQNASGPHSQLLSPQFTELFVHVGGVALEFFLYVVGMLRYTLAYPKPCGVGLIVFGLYFSFVYLEVSLAAAVELLSNFFWPLLHVALRGVESLFKAGGHLFTAVDEVGVALHCDLSSAWCSRFGLMCDDQCSFTSLALDRLRRAP